MFQLTDLAEPGVPSLTYPGSENGLPEHWRSCRGFIFGISQVETSGVSRNFEKKAKYFKLH